jgi:hypothetical protein
MTMNDKRVVFAGEHFGSRLRSFVKSALASVIRERVVVFRLLRFRFGRLRFGLLSMELRRIGADRLPRVAILEQQIRSIAQVELSGILDRFKPLPGGTSTPARSRVPERCTADDRLISAVAIDVVNFPYADPS